MATRTLPPTNNPIHLLRALLRECTYLPDPASRPLLTRYILSRFHEYHPPAATSASSKPKKNKYPPSPARQTSILTSARRGLSQLKRANEGDTKPLLKVLLFTYGRLGKRRRELMDELTARPYGALAEHGPWRAPPPHRDSNMEAWPEMQGRLAALIASQAAQELPRLERTVLTTAEPQVPRLNAWGRPLPKKRERNLRWEFYADTLDRVMPPLPEEEWARLRDLSNGRLAWEGVVKRRRRVEEEDANGRGGRALTERLFEAPLDKLRYRLVEGDPHRLTGRFMRRLWGKVFMQCPRVRWGGEGKGWEVVWGMDELDSRKVRTVSRDELMNLLGEVEDESTAGPSTSAQQDESLSTIVQVESQEGSRPLDSSTLDSNT
ncbi:MAG: hypothetical protein M1816_000674 [Peltula sp. TS41687]|nr:MAG: hypothetical protein M1816_000674 [Peltula sp. TS41687]